MIKQVLYIILLLNYSLTLYTLMYYGIHTNNMLFDICNNNILFFTFINILLYGLIKYYNTIKKIIK